MVFEFKRHGEDAWAVALLGSQKLSWENQFIYWDSAQVHKGECSLKCVKKYIK